MKTYLTGMILASLLAVPAALAAPHDVNLALFSATSDAFDDRLEFSITLDVNSDSTGLLYNEAGNEKLIPLASLPQGVVLYQSSGKDVVTLSSKTFDSVKGGTITLKHLVNGISNSYRNFEFTVGREGNNWVPYIINARGVPQPFTTMYLKAKRVLGKIVGIDTITVK